MTTLFDIKAHKGDIGGSICTPYKFNGKELDQETGYYYYGARYYDPQTALWFGTDPLAHKYPMNSPYVYCNGNPVIYIDSDGAEGFSVTASARITVGPQMGFDIGNFVKAEVNIGSVDVINISGTLGIDEYGVYPKGNYNIIGIDGLNWEQDASIGAGIPVFGDVELSAKNIFAAKNDHVISDDKKSGVELDVDMFKMSFDLKCIIGVETEINVDVTGKNTFIEMWDKINDFYKFVRKNLSDE